mmetsp:Transcript_32481/g.85253  ORF Transcript_32481/g.85253 Transcript_32481/m.85253 type:complete len:204 (-) Transcript_32481:808-1419(-)
MDQGHAACTSPRRPREVQTRGRGEFARSPNGGWHQARCCRYALPLHPCGDRSAYDGSHARGDLCALELSYSKGRAHNAGRCGAGWLAGVPLWPDWDGPQASHAQAACRGRCEPGSSRPIHRYAVRLSRRDAPLAHGWWTVPSVHAHCARDHGDVLRGTLCCKRDACYPLPDACCVREDDGCAHPSCARGPDRVGPRHPAAVHY